MTATLSVQPPLAAGLARYGFGPLPLAALKARYASPESGSKFIHVDGFDIHYRDEGCADKPVLLMVHGVMASLHTWDGWVAELSEHFRIIRLDVPGFGLTGGGQDREYDGERLVKVFGMFLDRLDLKHVSIAGNSLGGYIAWNYALVQPHRVERLILIDPAGYYMQKVPLMIASAVLPGAGVLMPMWMPRALVAQGIKEVYGDPRKIKPGVIDRYYDISRRPGNRRAMIDIFRVLVKANREELTGTPTRVAALNVPTMLMWGDRDRWISPRHVPMWQRDVPGIEVKVYPGVGHIPMEEIPEESAAGALRFLHA